MGLESSRGRGRGRGLSHRRKLIRLELSTSTSPACSVTISGSDEDAAPLTGRGGGLNTPADFIAMVYLSRGPKILPPHKLVPACTLTAAEVAAHMQQQHQSYLTFANAASVLAARVRLPRCPAALLLTPEELFIRTRVRLSRRLRRDCKGAAVSKEEPIPPRTCK